VSDRIWVWMIYQMDTRAIVGGVRRCASLPPQAGGTGIER